MSKVKLFTKACPVHGMDFMVRDGSAWYCSAPVDDKYGKCWYHPQNTKPREKEKIKEDKHPEEPDLMKKMVGEWMYSLEQTGRDVSNVTSVYRP